MDAHTENIYTLEEKNEMDISSLWQRLQVVFYAFCIFFNLAVCYCFSVIMLVMEQNCILYSKIVFHKVKLNESSEQFNVTQDIKSVSSDFPTTYCNLVIYLPVLIVAFSSFFMVMFVICGRGGSGNQNLPDTWRIVMPTLFFNLICFVLSIFIASIVQGGLKKFTESIADQWGVKNLDLNDLNNLHLDGQEIGGYLVKYTIASKQAVWMLVCFWGLNFFWILLRCMFNVDFQLVRTTIHIYPKHLLVLHKYSKSEAKFSDSSTDSENIYEEPVSRSSSIRLRTVKFTPSTTDISVLGNLKDASTSVPNFSSLPDEDRDIHIKTTEETTDSTIKPSEMNDPQEVIVDMDNDAGMEDSSNQQTYVTTDSAIKPSEMNDLQEVIVDMDNDAQMADSSNQQTDVTTDSTKKPSEMNDPQEVIVDMDNDAGMADSSNQQTDVTTDSTIKPSEINDLQEVIIDMDNDAPMAASSNQQTDNVK